MKKYLSFAAIIVLIMIIVLVVTRKKDGDVKPAPSTPVVTATSSSLNLTYEVDGESITLVNGKAITKAAPGSAAEITTEIFGEPVLGQMGMGEDTAVMFLAQQGGGTGVFFYAVAAYRENGVYKGSKAFFLGDRIAPQNIRIVYGEAQVNYADRKENEPLSAEPSVGVTKYLVLKDGVLEEK